MEQLAGVPPRSEIPRGGVRRIASDKLVSAR